MSGEQTPPPAATATVGIDIGSQTAKVVLGSSRGCEIVRNEVGGHTTPSVITFANQLRNIGPTANAKAKHSVQHLNRLLSGEMDMKMETSDSSSKDGDSFADYYQFDWQQDGKSVSVQNLDYNGESKSFSSAALVAMLLGKLKSSVQATLQRQGNDDVEKAVNSLCFVLSCGPHISPEAQTELVDAAYAAGIQNVKLVDTPSSYHASYRRKFPEHSNKSVMVVDMGHAQTTVAVLGSEPVEGNDEAEDSKEEKEGDAVEESTKVSPPSKVLSSVRHVKLGAGTVDTRLWDHFQSTVPALANVSKKSRSGQRLLDGMQKLKHLLSQLPEATITVENVGEHDSDLKLDGSRTLMSDVCQADKQQLHELIQMALTQANVNASDLFAIEVVGGGCRMPWVKDTILKVTGKESLSYSLDDTSAALGAALMGEDSSASILTQSSFETPTTEQVKLREAEQAMTTLDVDMQLRASILNQMEAHILELRSAKHNATHGHLLPEELDGYLMSVEDWIFSEEADNATKEQMQTKWDETQAKTSELTKSYREALAKEQADKDAEMEAEAKLAQAEDEANNNGEEDDHDNRRLPKKRRMEIVVKNKGEANELFADGNFKFAAARYTKALSHCAKFVDLGPEDIEEVNSVKLSLNLNLALAYLKLKNPDQALRVCNDALAIDSQHTKALYRRASVYYEKKQFDAAGKDLKLASKAAPDDKAISKLQAKVDAQLQRQKQKEKKMAQKMFG